MSVLRKLSPRLPENHLLNHQRLQNIAPSQKRRQRCHQLRHPQSRPKRSAPLKNHKLRQRGTQHLHHHLVNSTWAIYSNRELLPQQPVPRPRAQLPRKVRAIRHQGAHLHPAAVTVWSGSIPRRMFTTGKARVFTARRRRVNTSPKLTRSKRETKRGRASGFSKSQTCAAIVCSASASVSKVAIWISGP